VGDCPAAPTLRTERLVLEPLRVDHAEEMAPLLADPALHAFTGGRPATLEELRHRYARQAGGRSPDGAQRWLNWIVRLEQTGAAVGTMQATVGGGERGPAVAELAWVMAATHQGHGYAIEAAAGMARWLREQGTTVLAANIHPDHEASMHVARALGLAPTEEVVNGEVRWTARAAAP
jgi:RimJ/RimL family protein N-acetyltransferase